MAILVLNAGSSSLKFAIIDPATGQSAGHGMAERIATAEAAWSWTLGTGDAAGPLPLTDGSIDGALLALATLLQDHPGLGLTAIGHRVVHGGIRFDSARLVDDQVVAEIAACIPLAPLHNPANLAGIATTRRLFPHLPQAVVFDTAFHHGMPERAFRYAVPTSWYRDHGVRRYGFHGTSHCFVAGEAARRLGRPLADLRLVTAHLGNGCSACAVLGGRSIDTTMGMTPLEGLVMGTRSGDIDPGILAHLTSVTGIDGPTLTDALNHESGLLGLSDLSNDMRTLTAAADGGHRGARLAITVFCYRLAKSIAALAVPLGGFDALIFTGGIGEHCADVRSQTIAQLRFLGLVEDGELNRCHGTTAAGRITRPGSPCAMVIPTNEEWAIARETALLTAPSPHRA
jgi:acetate kinase